METRVAATLTKTLIALVESWDTPAMLLRRDTVEPIVSNTAVFDLLSWADARDKCIEIVPPDFSQGLTTLQTIVYPHQGMPRVVFMKAATYVFPDVDNFDFILVICDLQPEAFLTLFIACLGAHIQTHFSKNLPIYQWSKQLLDRMEACITWKESNLTYAGVNAAFADFVGQTPDALIGKNDNIFTISSMQNVSIAHDLRILSEFQSVRNIFMRGRRADGLPLWLRVHKSPLKDGSGRILGVVTVLEQLSEFQMLENSDLLDCMNEQSALRHLLDNAVSILFTCSTDDDYPVLFLTDNAKSWQIPLEKLMGGAGFLRNLIYEEDVTMVMSAVEEHYPQTEPFWLTHRLRHNNGALHYMRTTLRFVTVNQRTLLEGSMQDITSFQQDSHTLLHQSTSLQEQLGFFLQENISPIGNEIPLYQVVDILEAQSWFAKAFALNAAIVDLEGKQLTDQISYSNTNDICELLQLTTGRNVCQQSFARLIRMVVKSGHNEILQCDVSGHMMTATPICVGERIVAVWILCQMMVKNPNLDLVRHAANYHDYDPAPYLAMMADAPEYEMARFENARSVLDIISVDISMLATRNAQLMIAEDTLQQTTTKLAKQQSCNELLATCFALEQENAPTLSVAYQMLDTVCQQLRFSRAYYYTVSDTGQLVLQYEFANKNCAKLPWEARKVARIDDLFPPYTDASLVIYEAAKVQDLQTARYASLTGARSIVHMPVWQDGRFVGLLGLDECVFMRIYFDEDVRLLSSLLGVIANLVCRTNEMKQATLMEESTNQVLNALPLLVFHEQQGIVTYANALVQKLCPDEPILQQPIVETPLAVFLDSSQSAYALQSRWFHCARKSLLIEGQPVMAYTCTDITEQKKNEDRLAQLSAFDPLSQSLSFERFELDLQKLDYEGALVICDIDGLRHVNETISFTHGDHCLIAIAEFLRMSNATVYALNYLRFAILIQGDEAAVRQNISAIETRFDSLWDIDGESHFFSIHGGVAYTHQSKVFDCAEEAWSFACHHVGTHFVTYTAEMAARAALRQHLIEHGSMDADMYTEHVKTTITFAMNDSLHHHVELQFSWYDDYVQHSQFVEWLPMMPNALDTYIMLLQLALKEITVPLKRMFAVIPFPTFDIEPQMIVRRLSAMLRQLELPNSCLVIAIPEHEMAQAALNFESVYERLRAGGFGILLTDYTGNEIPFGRLTELPCDMVAVSPQLVINAKRGTIEHIFVQCLSKTLQMTHKKLFAQGINTPQLREIANSLPFDALSGICTGDTPE